MSAANSSPNMNRPLRIAEDYSLAPETMGARLAICASGALEATRAALVVVEEMLETPYRVVIIDPVGVCWGLRMTADGRPAGVHIPLLGGANGDYALPVESGEKIADWLVEERRSVVLDLSGEQADQRGRFTRDLLGGLRRRRCSAIHLVFMADEVVPGAVSDRAGGRFGCGELAGLLHATSEVGLGFTLVTDRAQFIPQVLMAQIDLLLAVGKLTPLACDALGRIAADRLPGIHAGSIVAEMSSLGAGEVCVTSLNATNLLRRVRLRDLRTYLGPLRQDEVGAHFRTPPLLEALRLPTLESALSGAAEFAGGASTTVSTTVERRAARQGLTARERNMLAWLARRADAWFEERQQADAQLAGAIAALAAAVHRVRDEVAEAGGTEDSSTDTRSA